MSVRLMPQDCQYIPRDIHRESTLPVVTGDTVTFFFLQIPFALIEKIWAEEWRQKKSCLNFTR